MTHAITARFSDGMERTFAVEEGQSLLDAALAQDINLIHQCKGGSCSSCICQRVSGDLAMTTGTSIALLPREIAEGKLLACLALASSDSVVEFPYESSLLERPGPERFVTDVISCNRLSEAAFELVLGLDDYRDDELPEFQPGAYFMLSVPDSGLQRAYSVASIPSELPDLRFLIRHLPGGAMSTYLAEHCQPGDRIEIEGPFGDFMLHKADAPLAMIAGGTGLAPLLSMIDALAETRRHRAGIALYFGVRSYDDLFFLDELAVRSEMVPNFTCHVAVEQPDPRWTGTVGRVTDLLNTAPPPANAAAYLCGPPGMIDAAIGNLTALGLAEDHVFYERFAPAVDSAPKDDVLAE